MSAATNATSSRRASVRLPKPLGARPSDTRGPPVAFTASSVGQAEVSSRRVHLRDTSSAAPVLGTMSDVMSGHRVLFVCVQNAGRSQIAEAMFNALSAGTGEARSAGTRPADEVHPHVGAALAERGFDVHEKIPHRLSLADADWADIVVTMGCGDECPVTGKPTEDWELPDPKTMSAFDLAQLIDEIEVRVADLLRRLDQKTATA